jgi:hypothetical protein
VADGVASNSVEDIFSPITASVVIKTNEATKHKNPD